jgi:hypothetical protein
MPCQICLVHIHILYITYKLYMTFFSSLGVCISCTPSSSENFICSIFLFQWLASDLLLPTVPVRICRVCVTISSFAVHCVLKHQFVDNMSVAASSKLHIFKVSGIFSWFQSVILSYRLFLYIFVSAFH